MRQPSVKVLLLLTILIMTALPMVAAFYFLDSALQTSLDLGFNKEIVEVLENESRNLKTLKSVDPQNEDRYREQFNEVEELKHIYARPELVKCSIIKSLTIYFGIGLVAAALISVLLATLLSRSIARTYRATFDELSRHKERVRYLEEMSSWQELAKMLAHEIKNPLTPIEVLVTSLSKAYLAKPQSEFQAQLSQTQAMINEELAHLKNTVNKFSEFAKLPSVQLLEVDLFALLAQHVQVIGATFTSAQISLIRADAMDAMRAKIDSTLFRQVLTNIIRNGVEANPGRTVGFVVALIGSVDAITIKVSNDGVPVPIELASRIFDPYITGKAGKENMGLGLAIVRKIIIEHGGDIAYAEVGGRPMFTISLPKLA